MHPADWWWATLVVAVAVTFPYSCGYCYLVLLLLEQLLCILALYSILVLYLISLALGNLVAGSVIESAALLGWDWFVWGVEVFVTDE
jgi:hypothetical protein